MGHGDEKMTSNDKINPITVYIYRKPCNYVPSKMAVTIIKSGPFSDTLPVLTLIHMYVHVSHLLRVGRLGIMLALSSIAVGWLAHIPLHILTKLHPTQSVTGRTPKRVFSLYRIMTIKSIAICSDDDDDKINPITIENPSITSRNRLSGIKTLQPFFDYVAQKMCHTYVRTCMSCHAMHMNTCMCMSAMCLGTHTH